MSAHLSDKCIACQFVKSPVEVRFLGQEMWIMDSGRSDELFVKECTTSSISRRNCFTFEPQFGIMIAVILYRFLAQIGAWRLTDVTIL